MIGSIKGKIILKNEKFVVVEAGGIGYKVNVISSEASTKDEVFFWTHTHVREDCLDLYGFTDYEELEFFEMLINVSGIGPKGALSILGITSIDTLAKAIKTGDTSYLTKISGIGRKTAEKIVIELRDKLEGRSKDRGDTSGNLREELDALEALKALGYSQHEAREVLQKIPTETNTNAKIKEALKMLGQR